MIAIIMTTTHFNNGYIFVCNQKLLDEKYFPTLQFHYKNYPTNKTIPKLTFVFVLTTRHKHQAIVQHKFCFLTPDFSYLKNKLVKQNIFTSCILSKHLFFVKPFILLNQQNLLQKILTNHPSPHQHQCS